MPEESKSVFVKAISSGWLFVLIFAVTAAAQIKPQGTKPASAVNVSVTTVDQTRYAELIKPKGKPLLINFWATWCTPCREEFPDLVKIDAEYKGKIDFITISLDFEEELTTGVPKFLRDMKAEMPTYLLVTPDETAAIAMISKDWGGGLPFTALYSMSGELVYFHQGIIKPADLKVVLDKLLSVATAK